MALSIPDSSYYNTKENSSKTNCDHDCSYGGRGVNSTLRVGIVARDVPVLFQYAGQHVVDERPSSAQVEIVLAQQSFVHVSLLGKVRGCFGRGGNGVVGLSFSGG